MTREEKAVVIDELAGKFAANKNFYITDASGMTVGQVNSFRRLCFQRGVEYCVYKNTLIKKALEKHGVKDISPLAKSLKGFSGLIFSGDIANAPAKVLQEYQKKHNAEKPAFKAASIESEYFVGADQLKTLGDLKSKNELIGEVISLLQSPAKNVVSALLSGKQKVAGLVKALEERKS
jgi:large subunit ribosomal protein L10